MCAQERPSPARPQPGLTWQDPPHALLPLGGAAAVRGGPIFADPSRTPASPPPGAGQAVAQPRGARGPRRGCRSSRIAVYAAEPCRRWRDHASPPWCGLLLELPSPSAWVGRREMGPPRPPDPARRLLILCQARAVAPVMISAFNICSYRCRGRRRLSSSAIAVQDLMALGDVLLLPRLLALASS